ncbi:MAG: prolyl aminopeptidase [Methyloprofundus sp.]|nr:prolyl aminopeptidase [Methyloprofundus sp.]
MQSLYPEIEPFHTFFLETASQHKVYVEQSGNPEGIPVLFLHGGPCSGTRPQHRRFFNPELYHIILFDQRGCGLSQPFGELEENNTQNLIADMERIRQQLKIDRWLLFSGSWGSTLALLYAQQFKDYVFGIIVRGVFLARQEDLEWFAGNGANRLYPEQWQELLDSLPVDADKEQPMHSVFTALWGDDEVAVRRVTRAWMQWTSQVALGAAYERARQGEHITQTMVDQVKMELHYARNHYFIRENQVLEGCAKLQDTPVIIIHGRYDFVCPMQASFKLFAVLPHAEYKILPTAGHIAQGDAMIDALVAATDTMAEKLK